MNESIKKLTNELRELRINHPDESDTRRAERAEYAGRNMDADTRLEVFKELINEDMLRDKPIIEGLTTSFEQSTDQHRFMAIDHLKESAKSMRDTAYFIMILTATNRFRAS